MANEKSIADFTEIQEVFAGSYFHVNIGGVDYKISGTNLITSLNGGNPFKVMVSEESSTTRSLTVEDKNRYIYFTHASGATVNLDPMPAASFDIGDTITLRNESGGNVDIISGVGVTIQPAASGMSLTDDGQTGQLLCVAPNVFHFLTGG
jgi:hypothetical protein